MFAPRGKSFAGDGTVGVVVMYSEAVWQCFRQPRFVYQGEAAPSLCVGTVRTGLYLCWYVCSVGHASPQVQHRVYGSPAAIAIAEQCCAHWQATQTAPTLAGVMQALALETRERWMVELICDSWQQLCDL